MTISTAPSRGVPARIAPAPESAPIASLRQSLAAGSVNTPTTPDPNRWQRRALLAAGLVLAAVSITLAALAGYARGASPAESLVWSAAGAALAVVSLVGLSVVLRTTGTARRTAFAAWLLSLAFTVIHALGSQHGGREHAARVDGTAEGNRARLEAAYRRATDQLAVLPATRPSGVVGEELSVALKDTRLAGCRGWVESRRLRTVCAEVVEPLRAELATADAREAAQKAASEASAALGALAVTRPANTDAAAVARYLAAVGITLAVDRLADLISLLTVVAIEIVGAVAIALGRQQLVAAPRQLTAADVHASPRDGGALAVQKPVSKPPPTGVQSQVPRAVNTETSDTIERLKARIVGDLELGPRACSQRALANELGVSVGYVNKVLKELAGGGRVNVHATHSGTRLELVSA